MRHTTFLLLLVCATVRSSIRDEPACPEKLLIQTQKVVAIDGGKTLLTPSGSRFRHFSMRPYSFGEGKQYKTVLYYPSRAAEPEKANAVVALLHGMNADISHAGSMFNAMNALTKREGNIENDSPLDQMRQLTKRVQNVYAEAIDQPGCGNNSDLCPLTFEGMIGFYSEYLSDLRKRSQGRPLVAVGFCYSSGFLIEVNRRNPGLIDALVLTGLIIPDPITGFQYAVDVENEMYRNGTLTENPAVHYLADKAYAQLTWSHQSNPTGRTPTLLLIGERDPFQSPAAINWFRQWAVLSSDSVRLRLVEGAGHGVLGPIESFPQSFVSVLVDINELISKTILAQSKDD